MEATTVRTQEGFSLTVTTGKRDGLLGKLGIGNTAGIDAVCCPSADCFGSTPTSSSAQGRENECERRV